LNEAGRPLPKRSSFPPRERYYQRMQARLDAMEESLALLRQSAELRQELYRIYFLDAQNGIMAAEFFSASGDRAAAQVAALVHDASSDVSTGYELWREADRIASGRHAPQAAAGPKHEDVIQAHQDIIVDLEERVQRAFACVARSRKLVETAAKVRQQTK